jgi:hypothetical protein
MTPNLMQSIDVCQGALLPDNPSGTTLLVRGDRLTTVPHRVGGGTQRFSARRMTVEMGLQKTQGVPV